MSGHRFTQSAVTIHDFIMRAVSGIRYAEYVVWKVVADSAGLLR